MARARPPIRRRSPPRRTATARASSPARTRRARADPSGPYPERRRGRSIAVSCPLLASLFSTPINRLKGRAATRHGRAPRSAMIRCFKGTDDSYQPWTSEIVGRSSSEPSGRSRSLPSFFRRRRARHPRLVAVGGAVAGRRDVRARALLAGRLEPDAPDRPRRTRHRYPGRQVVFIYAGAVFANNVTPFGQAGGEPVAALLISKTSDARYETSLVGIASVDVLNVVPSISLILVGVGYYATTAALGDHLVTAVGSAVVLIAGIVIALGLVWRYHQAIVDRLPGIVAPDSAGSGSSASSPRRSRRTSPTDWDDSSRTSNAWRRIGGDCPPSSGCRCVAGSFRSPRSWQRLPRLGPPFRRTSCCS